MTMSPPAPRGQQREDAILNTVITLLRNQGYQAITIDMVAAHAHASKATIYRRWRNKVELVKAALDAYDLQRNATILDTGELRSDLIAVMQALRDTASAPYIAMVNDLIAAAKHDKDLTTALQAHINNDELSPFKHVLTRAIKRDGLNAAETADLVHDVAEAMIHRQIQLELPFDDDFILRVVDGVLLPLLHTHAQKNAPFSAAENQQLNDK